MTATSKRRRGFQPNTEGLAILEARRLEKGYTLDSLAEAAGLNSNDQVRRLFNPHWEYKVQRDAIEKIAVILELQPAEFIEDWLPKSRGSKQKQTPIDVTNIDWQRVCQEMLHEQQEEQRFRRRATEMGFEVNVFVPLGLIERKQQQRRSGNVPMELLHQLEPEVVTRIYEHDEFMTDVIGQNPTGKNQHIAIVGEPGAGKTTLLDKIATHIQENNQDLPICIALASLQRKTLKDYILQEWLPEAMALVYPDIDVEMFHEKSLQKRLRHGGIWLLLDGVDEMAVGANSCLSLEEIRNQLTDWLGNVRVVLTCRTNVWDARVNNPLTGFDTYKTQEFKPPQVDDFIQQWFAEAKNIQRGQELQKKLQEPQKERIRQLVKNPLRLSLLCQIFNNNKQAELPETKAELYKYFVCDFYEWKPAQSGIDWATEPDLQKELHQALGRLSIAGLDSDARFRLPLSLIQQEMGDRLFKLAWDLGWLNLVDREAATDEPVYAFFHPTFQEYFASLVIDNYQFFMERYRIFETQWLEVAILWLENPQISALLKKELIDTITNLKEDKWKNMYRLKLLPLNIVYSCQSGEIEFIAGRVCFVCLDDNIQTKVYKFMLPGYEEFIIESLKYYAPKEACYIISEIINNTDLELYELSRLLEVLFKINPEHECLKVLIPKLLKDDREGRAIEVAKIALKHDNFKQIAVDFLVNVLLNEEEQYELQNISIINILMDSKILDKVVIGKLISFKLFNGEEIAIAKIKQTNFEVIDKIIEIIQTNKDHMLRHICIKVLLMETLSKQSIIEELVNLIVNLKDSQIQWFVVAELQQITHKPQLQRLVFGLKDYVEDAVANLDKDLYIIAYSVLWHCANNLSYTEFYDACCVQPSCTDLEALENISIANSSTARYLNFVEQLSVLQSAVSHNEELNQAVQLICIDGSEFNPPDNPATDIYIQMVEQGCPERQEGTPTTMPLLKAYWRLNLRNLEKRVALVFYNSKIDREFSEPFLTALSAFGGTIAIITDRPCDNVKRISPNHPNLIDAVLKWLHRSILEA